MAAVVEVVSFIEGRLERKNVMRVCGRLLQPALKVIAAIQECSTPVQKVLSLWRIL